VNGIVDNIYVVNMKKDTIRLNKFKTQVGDKFKYQIVEGVDCDSAQYKDKFKIWEKKNPISQNVTFEQFDWLFYLNNNSDLKKIITTKNMAWNHWINHGIHNMRSCNANRIVNKGQWGCLQSHVNILKDALEKNYETILILEDDVRLSKGFDNQIERITQIQQMNPDWNIIYTGASQHNWIDIEFQKDFYYAKGTTGTFSYIVRKSFYQIFIDEFEKRLKPVDNYLVDMQAKYYKSMIVLFPNIMICNVEESNIGQKRNQLVCATKFKWLLDDYHLI
jgi:GR25 family glycosyltransferase involved in LPS biosynthesis